MSFVLYKLREFLFEKVYESDKIRKEFVKAKGILSALYHYYYEHIEEVFGDVKPETNLNRHRMVCDFIAGMTDSFALMTYERLFLPEQWKVF
jgi:dGTPase